MLNQTLAKQEGDFNAENRWAIVWFERQCFAAGNRWIVETFDTAKNTSIQRLELTAILASESGKVRLLSLNILPEDWDPATDSPLR